MYFDSDKRLLTKKGLQQVKDSVDSIFKIKKIKVVQVTTYTKSNSPFIAEQISNYLNNWGYKTSAGGSVVSYNFMYGVTYSESLYGDSNEYILLVCVGYMK